MGERPRTNDIWGLDDLEEHLIPLWQYREEPETTISEFRVMPDKRDFQIVGPKGRSLDITNWSFSQLCGHADAPPDFLCACQPD